MRSEGDTWDITTSVGSTALFVATARALEAQKPNPLVVDQYAEVFFRAVGGSAADVLDGKDCDHHLKSADFGDHFVNFQAARTKYFDEYFLRAAQAGVRQVVIVAAGLDSRAYRLDWPAATTIFELDRPQVLDFKREVLAGHGDQPRAERREVAVDLRDDWPQALRDSGFDPAMPSAWIAEGLLVYLPAAAQEQLFTGIDGLAGHGSHVAVEDGAPLQADEFEAAVEEERAAARQGDGRLFFQLVYNEQHAPAADWFGQHGWNAVGTPLADYLREVGRPVPGLEIEAGPMIARNTLVSAVRA
ncbi:class I SAM-dependent methyltransferase [Mycobacterium montefiorense]|uniref:S-adenosyl-L-methionine-dependent methyltransferase n=1 Tax=Mycobacterium montefiorense TaxID=154654 RepID=A0ABQ0NMK9_9MYCO|nr:class I SAM-dependent methyltransferase [Mycobacterium montefiorense]GBG38109.1 putative S-adenosyl-L-methionine-dependent methyltransferase [Mycobacterium montefiorense]GKU33741.1 putative S-adenosyl-L-methionine-dependent methyltransferase [Mycobacterium montefiorense]GKU39861.1 putative S-adenosyl-L-methionine-dependent methyltransferase [Mycobacterium montefiorense]GKU43667.1 putative S-adenosyl-L-methionine-dependent methyltransferase [Mycobacterium montefiorense]GKU51687.1 putative S-